MTWEIFKKAFHCRFFARLMRESKVVEFINIHQGGMSVQYSLKFTKSSKYDPPLISDPRDEMSRFVTGYWMIFKKSVICLCYMTKLTFSSQDACPVSGRGKC